MICMEDFAPGDVVSLLPNCRAAGCRAVFHLGVKEKQGADDCGGITQWLETHTACPLVNSLLFFYFFLYLEKYFHVDISGTFSSPKSAERHCQPTMNLARCVFFAAPNRNR